MSNYGKAKRKLAVLMMAALFLAGCSQQKYEPLKPVMINKTDPHLPEEQDPEEPDVQEDSDTPPASEEDPAENTGDGSESSSTEGSITVYPVDRSVQETAWYCGPAVMQMLLSHYGYDVSQDDLAEQMKTSRTTGTEYADMAACASTYVFGGVPAGSTDPGFRSWAGKENGFSQEDQSRFLQRLKTDMESKDLLSAAIDTSVLYPQLGVRATHVVLINGIDVDRDGNITRIRIEDPWYEIEYSSEEDHWVDTALFLNAMNSAPEPGYIW